MVVLDQTGCRFLAGLSFCCKDKKSFEKRFSEVSVVISVKRASVKRCQDDIFPRIELIPSFVLSSDNTNCKNDIQLFHQLFDELSVYRDYH